jgi:hypothetical protein
MAGNCLQLKDYAEVKQHYWKAAAMCPVKFVPLYELVKMYAATGRKSETVALAEQIINKPIKIVSPIINSIQGEMMQLIKEEKDSDSIPKNQTSKFKIRVHRRVKYRTNKHPAQPCLREDKSMQEERLTQIPFKNFIEILLAEVRINE